MATNSRPRTAKVDILSLRETTLCPRPNVCSSTRDEHDRRLGGSRRAKSTDLKSSPQARQGTSNQHPQIDLFRVQLCYHPCSHRLRISTTSLSPIAQLLLIATAGVHKPRITVALDHQHSVRTGAWLHDKGLQRRFLCRAALRFSAARSRCTGAIFQFSENGFRNN